MDSSMSEAELEKLRYPVGRFKPRRSLSAEERAQMIDQIGTLPAKLRTEVEGLTDEQLDTPYRPDAGQCGKSCTICLRAI